MTSSSLPEQSRPPLTQRMPEPPVQANTGEAGRLYQRGVAAARSGQKRMAAGLLTRSVKLNPHNEGAWLWLSGVLESPHEIAFCLKTVLQINPQNERAQRGLKWLDERQMLQEQASTTPLMRVRLDESASERAARAEGESWWVSWRQWRRDTRRVNLLLWGLPVLLLLLSVALYETFALAVEQSQTPPLLPTTPSAPTAAPLAVAPADLAALPTPLPVIALQGELTTVRESETLAYMAQLEPLRADLRQAVETFRNSTGSPGDTFGHVRAAQDFRSSVETAYATLQAATPPDELSAAHDAYLQGLEHELAAIDDIIEFYGSYRVEFANRAAARFQQANTSFDQARTLFALRQQQIQQTNLISPFNIR